MKRTGQIEEEVMRHANRALISPIVVQQPISANYIPLFTARRDTALDGFKVWYGVAEGQGVYGVLIVLPEDSVTLADGEIVSNRLHLHATAGVEYEFTIDHDDVSDMIPVLEAGETLVLAFDTNDADGEAYAATTPSTIRNLMLTPALREGVI